MNESKILPPSLPRPLPGVPFEENPLPFRLGETLLGRVMRQIDPQHAFLHLKGQNLLVESQAPLPTGADLRFRVEEVQPKVTLKLLPSENLPEQKIYSLLRRLLAGDVPLGPLAPKLSALGEGEFHGIPPSAQESWKEFLGLLRGFSPTGLFSTGPGALPGLLIQSGFLGGEQTKKLGPGRRERFPGPADSGRYERVGREASGSVERIGRLNQPKGYV